MIIKFLFAFESEKIYSMGDEDFVETAFDKQEIMTENLQTALEK